MIQCDLIPCDRIVQATGRPVTSATATQCVSTVEHLHPPPGVVLECARRSLRFAVFCRQDWFAIDAQVRLALVTQGPRSWVL